MGQKRLASRFVLPTILSMTIKTLMLYGLIVCCLLAACRQKEVPLPTALDPIATERAANATATYFVQITLVTLTPTPSITLSPTPSLTPSLTPSPTPSLTPTLTFTPSITFTPSATYTPPPPIILSPTPSPTLTLTPSITPTRVVNPDAVVGGSPAPLRIAPRLTAEAVTDLPSGTTLGIDAKSADGDWLQVRLLNGMGNGWVAASDVVIFKDLQTVPIFGATGTPTLPLRPERADLITPQAVTTETAGTGVAFLPYNFAACGDTYWTGDGLGASMEDLAYKGRYPRFAAQPIRVYVYGLNALPAEDQAAWEFVIAQTFAELSQAVQLERVYLDDLNFFAPFVPMTTLLADVRVDMVWHLTPRHVFEEDAPCEDSESCSAYGFRGAVMGGPLRFGGLVYVPTDVPNKKAALLHAALHALGLWVHSSQPTDILGISSRAERMSARDIATLRCLYTAPPYGDAVVDDR